VLKGVAACCSLLQCVALPQKRRTCEGGVHIGRSNVLALQGVAICRVVCCSVLQFFANTVQHSATHCNTGNFT